MLGENARLQYPFRIADRSRTELLDILQAQERCHFRDLIAGDQTWVYLDMKPGTVWFPADAELPVRVKRTIVSETCMLVVFWGIRGIAQYCWRPKDSILDSPFFCEKVLSADSIRSENAAKFQQNPQILDFGSYRQCKGSHGKGNSREIECFPIQTHITATVWPGYCTIRLSFRLTENSA
jgi:hypothetical protein